MITNPNVNDRVRVSDPTHDLHGLTGTIVKLTKHKDSVTLLARVLFDTGATVPLYYRRLELLPPPPPPPPPSCAGSGKPLTGRSVVLGYKRYSVEYLESLM